MTGTKNVQISEENGIDWGRTVLLGDKNYATGE